MFPDHQRLLRTTPAQRISVTTVDVRDRLATGPTRTMTQAPNNALHEVSVVLLTDQRIDVLEHDHPDAIGFNREFLLEALDASGADQLVLALDGADRTTGHPRPGPPRRHQPPQADPSGVGTAARGAGPAPRESIATSWVQVGRCRADAPRCGWRCRRCR